jgi:dCTP deaminase
MILSDKDVLAAIKEGKIKVEPFEEKNIMPIGVDLRLGNEFRIFKMDHKSHIDPSSPEIGETTYLVKAEKDKPFMVHPGDFVLGVTQEFVQLPDDIAGRIDGRSSLGRLGIIVHSTAGHADPGFAGKLTLEISNIGKLPVALYPGMKFCSLIFEKISTPVEHSYKEVGKYVGSTGPGVSKISEEFKKGKSKKN